MHYDKYNVLQKQYINLSMLEELYKDNSKVIISNNIIQSVWEQNNFQDPRCFTGANCKLNYVLNKLEQNIVITFDKDFKDSLKELPNNHTIKSISDLSNNQRRDELQQIQKIAINKNYLISSYNKSIEKVRTDVDTNHMTSMSNLDFYHHFKEYSSNSIFNDVVSINSKIHKKILVVDDELFNNLKQAYNKHITII